ncbi:acetyl-CoA/ propionyl-CoA carboxylase, carboxyltransferase subunit [Candidatus Nitrososphaera gargensis Ga9.2]|uniref:Acetyl-CoA/ propionyl-CoA carboxylase, carboxyltransferase subunit n=1 Tax=Nitrososphaera gargensis (strain Ga9.2) TaxID=1237085 RepID=K0I798_NITGG|nr:acyl-CoA carboxylase subunit beta [Candidatus Nitrososphaera gargensis]AFU57136.1 acetyl-CoA/ propionyl-CoA carboxylase, carboxyltransferase subunit [Candidatus Nitrososphaera gargensis Ga9.2]
MHEEKIKRLATMKKSAESGGGNERIEAQHSKGKLTARERIALLLDEGTFVELDKYVTHRSDDPTLPKFYGDGAVTGFGTIAGRQVFVFSYDFTVLGGSLGEMTGKKIAKAMDHAMKVGCPIIGIIDSGGARIQEGVMSLDGYGDIFFRNTVASGVIPQITASIGPCAGGAVYSPAMTDFVIMVENIGQMFVTGPEVVKEVLSQEVSFEELGGARAHATKSGVAHFIAKNEYECFDKIKKLLSFLPQNNTEEPAMVETNDDPNRIDADLINKLPENPYQQYDMKEIIKSIVDNGDFFEVHELWAENILVGFARMGGRSVGIVANQPQYLAGALDINSSNKAARFIRFCDAFNIPIVTLVDTPGYLPGTDQEHNGIIRNGSKLLFAYCEATVPKVTCIIGKAYGGAYIAMGSKNLRADINYAWPSAEIAVLGPEAAVTIIHRRELKNAPNAAETKKKLAKEYRDKFANPYIAAEKGIIDVVIDPMETRPMIIQALNALANKKEARPWKKHGNINL